MNQATRSTYFRYFPVSPRDEDWGLYVTTAGYVNIAPGADYPPSGHPQGYTFRWNKGRVLPEFQLHFIARGQGTFESKLGGKAAIETTSVFLLFPGEWHRYRPDEDTGWDEYWVGFNGDTARRLIDRGFFDPAKPVMPPVSERGMLDTFTELIRVMRQESPGFSQMLASLTSVLLARAFASHQASTSVVEWHSDVIAKAKDILSEDLEAEIDYQDMADTLHVSYAWLRRLFKRHTGLSMHQFRLQMRLYRAIELLNTSDAPIKEIAARLGFKDQHYFSRLFKDRTGKPPAEWRRASRRGS